MKSRYILLLLLAISSQLSFGQKIGDYYVAIANNNGWADRLKFLSDSTVEISTTPHHMSRSTAFIFNYTSSDSTIEILPNILANNDSHAKGLLGLFSASLSKVDGGFIDHSRSLIYVRRKAFDKNPDLTYIIDGKVYIQDSGETSGYGTLRTSGKINRALQKKLKSIDLEHTTIEFVKGLDAFRRFGIRRVYGVVVISTPKNHP